MRAQQAIKKISITTPRRLGSGTLEYALPEQDYYFYGLTYSRLTWAKRGADKYKTNAIIPMPLYEAIKENLELTVHLYAPYMGYRPSMSDVVCGLLIMQKNPENIRESFVAAMKKLVNLYAERSELCDAVSGKSDMDER